MPDCLLHIGVEKTGSTSIQMTLARNRPQLAEKRILYPAAFGERNHVKAYAYASEGPVDELKGPLGLDSPQAIKAFREALRSQLAGEIAAKKPRLLVVSNEHCSSRLLELAEIERLARLLRRHCESVKVVAYIRSQGEALRSAYSTYVKTGGTDDLLPPGPEEIARKYDYEAILGRWAEVFGANNLEVRIFAREALISGDVVEDFLTRLSLAPQDFTLMKEMNKSLGRAASEFLRRFNRFVPYTRGAEFNLMRGNIHNLLETLPDDAPFVGDPNIMAGLDAAMAGSNERVRARYRPEQSAPLFAPSEARPADDAPVSEEEITRAMAFLWESKQQQCVRLKQRLEGAGQKQGSRQPTDGRGGAGLVSAPAMRPGRKASRSDGGAGSARKGAAPHGGYRGKP